MLAAAAARRPHRSVRCEAGPSASWGRAGRPGGGARLGAGAGGQEEVVALAAIGRPDVARVQLRGDRGRMRALARQRAQHRHRQYALRRLRLVLPPARAEPCSGLKNLYSCRLRQTVLS